MAVTRLNYVSLYVTDLDLAKKHYEEIVGLRVTNETKNQVYFQSSDSQDHHCLIINASDRAGIEHIGFKVSDPSDMQEIKLASENYGLEASIVGAGEILGIGEGVKIKLPSGHYLNFFYHADVIGYANGMFNPKSVADEVMGVNPLSHLDHLLVTCEDPAKTIKFLQEVLDFNVSETASAPDGSMIAGFATVGNTMHNIAFSGGPNGGLHHIAFYAYDRADVIRRTDLLKSRNVPTMEFGLTRHGVAGVTTIYFFDPSGNRNEFQCGAYETPGVPDRVELVTWDVANLMGKGGFYYEAAVEPTFFNTVS